MSKITEELSDERVALELLKKDCLSCRRCAIGGKCPDGTVWDSINEGALDDEFDLTREVIIARPNPEPISNVFSTMNLDADVMVVGQNPGAEEIKSGVPFVGPSGKVFDEALERIVGLRRADVYVTNLVKCYTSGNRKPTQGEIDNCRDFLDLEVKLVRPKVIVALGSCSFKVLTGMSGIMKNCGRVVMSPRHMIPVVAMLHPSPYNTNHPDKRRMFEDGMDELRRQLEGGE